MFCLYITVSPHSSFRRSVPPRLPDKMDPAPTIRSHNLSAREKELIFNVNRYFLDEKANRGPIIPPTKAVARTARATRVSEQTVQRICSKPNRALMTQISPDPPVFTTPKRKRLATVTNFDDSDKRVVRRTTLQFYEKNENPTLCKIREELKESISYNGSIESLRRVIVRMGFMYGKVDGRKYLMERSEVTAARTKYIREMRQLKQAFHNVVYLDETWVNQDLTLGKCFTDKVFKHTPGGEPPCRKGNYLIILHAGTRDGFVNNAELVFQAENKTNHDNPMNSAFFEKWFRNQLLPNIAPNSAIVMDSASYHSEQLENVPSPSWRKSDIKDWLMKKGVQPSDDLLKAELYELSKKFDKGKKYRIDVIAEEAGHMIIRIPPDHCEYNPIEFIWAQMKSYLAENTIEMPDPKLLVRAALSLITPQDWVEAVERAEQLQEADAKQDIAVDHFMASLFITITESSDEEYSD